MNMWNFYSKTKSKLSAGEKARMSKKCVVCGEPIPILGSKKFCSKHLPKPSDYLTKWR